MKKLITLIGITFFLSSLGGTSEGFAQDTQLFDNTWYLEKIILDNGDEHVPVPNDEGPYIVLKFNDESPYYFETSVCNNFVGEVNYLTNNNFLITHSESTLLLCEPMENYYFEGIQFGFFTEGGDHIEDPFPYTITINGGNKTLIINNNRDDQAIYGDKLLSNKTFDELRLSIYPNPVKNTLTIQNPNTSLSGTTVNVFDINGKLITTKSPEIINSNISLNVTHLKSGIYFLNVINEEGRNQILRFIKK